jgi:hypothetical protein
LIKDCVNAEIAERNEHTTNRAKADQHDEGTAMEAIEWRLHQMLYRNSDTCKSKTKEEGTLRGTDEVTTPFYTCTGTVENTTVHYHLEEDYESGEDQEIEDLTEEEKIIGYSQVDVHDHTHQTFVDGQQQYF